MILNTQCHIIEHSICRDDVEYITVSRKYKYYIQGDPSIKDISGPAILPTVERLSTLQRWKIY